MFRCCSSREKLDHLRFWWRHALCLQGHQRSSPSDSRSSTRCIGQLGRTQNLCCSYHESLSRADQAPPAQRPCVVLYSTSQGSVHTSVCENGDTLRHWMRRIMTRCGVDPKFTGGSIRQAASSKAIDEGWEVAAVLKMGMWKSFATWNRFYNRFRLSMAPGPTFQAAG